jgi:protein-disulfide isomerase
MFVAIMTQRVNRTPLEKGKELDYNLTLIGARGIDVKNQIFVTLIGGLLAVSLGCGKKSSAQGEEDYKPIANTFDDSEPPPEKRQPLEGIDTKGLDDAQKERFEALADKLASPCGKAHSLRTSKNTDAECVRAKFALEYVVALLVDGASDSDARELYDLKYREAQKHGFKLDGVPHQGPEDASVVLVEFFDYGCPACARFKPVLDEALEAYPADAVLYFKMFPLSAHPDSPGAAQAVLAAAKQGKFLEMHKVLFEKQHNQKKADLDNYAKSIGLDMGQFQKDYTAAEGQVLADRKEGEGANVMGTPTIFLNGRPYEGPENAKYLKMWIAEELAVNR